jgi:hypothetical protein
MGRGRTEISRADPEPCRFRPTGTRVHACPVSPRPPCAPLNLPGLPVPSRAPLRGLPGPPPGLSRAFPWGLTWPFITMPPSRAFPNVPPGPYRPSLRGALPSSSPSLPEPPRASPGLPGRYQASPRAFPSLLPPREPSQDSPQAFPDLLRPLPRPFQGLPLPPPGLYLAFPPRAFPGLPSRPCRASPRLNELPIFPSGGTPQRGSPSRVYPIHQDPTRQRMARTQRFTERSDAPAS